MAAIHSIEGIVLKSLPFRNHDCIFTVFTKDLGKLTFILKGTKKKPAQAFCSPLNCVELTYRETKGDIWACEHLAILNSYWTLRSHLPKLETACDLLYTLNASQRGNKEAPQLYELLVAFLGGLVRSSNPNPEIIKASFCLKLLRHEGIFTFPMHCSICQHALIQELCYLQNQFFCRAHAPLMANYFSADELALVTQLTLERQLTTLLSLPLTGALKTKIDLFFREQMKGA